MAPAPALTLLTRRSCLAGAGLLLAAPLAWSRQGGAGAMDWMPYPADQVMRLEPTLARPAVARVIPPRPATRTLPASVRIEPVIADFEPVTAAGRRAIRFSGHLPALGSQPPRAYVRTAHAYDIDPWLLYGVALQESRIAFGRRALPYPWTLCVRGQGLRYASYDKTLAALKGYVQRGITNVDCGAMQVNWHWHSAKLGSFARALDPYPNLQVGARILRDTYERSGNWRQAVALYHTGSADTQAKRDRGARYASQTFSRLARMGVHVSGARRG